MRSPQTDKNINDSSFRFRVREGLGMKRIKCLEGGVVSGKYATIKGVLTKLLLWKR